MARRFDVTRKDTYYPAESVEVFRLLFDSSLTLGRAGDTIVLYLPPAKEHAQNLVDRLEPVFSSVILEEDREV